MCQVNQQCSKEHRCILFVNVLSSDYLLLSGVMVKLFRVRVMPSVKGYRLRLRLRLCSRCLFSVWAAINLYSTVAVGTQGEREPRSEMGDRRIHRYT